MSRATLHNQDEIERKDIQEGDTIIVQRAGDVIPQVVEVVKKHRPSNSQPYKFPIHCPVCGSLLAQRKVYPILIALVGWFVRPKQRNDCVTLYPGTHLILKDWAK